MLAVYAGECLDLLHTGEALAFGFSAFLRQLRSRERLCNLDNAAFAALQSRARSEFALVASGANVTGGRKVGADPFPLFVCEAVQLTGLVASLALGLGPASIPVGSPIYFVAAERLQQQRGPLRRAAVEQPAREAAEEKHVLPAADAADGHGSESGVGALVDAQVQEHCCHRLPLAGMGSYGKGWHQRDLRASDLESGLGAVLVQEPRSTHGHRRVEPGLAGAVQLPFGAFKLDVHHLWLLLVVRPDPRVHVTDAPLQEGLLRAIQMLRQGDWHANGQGQHAAEVAGIAIVVLEPAHLCSLVARLRLQHVTGGSIPGHGEAQGCLSVFAIRPGSVFVNLGSCIVVGHDGNGCAELGLLEARILWSADEPAARGAFGGGERAAVHPVAMQIAVVGLGQPPLSKLVDHFIPPSIFTALPLHQLCDSLERAAPEEVSAVLGQEVALGDCRCFRLMKQAAWTGAGFK